MKTDYFTYVKGGQVDLAQVSRVLLIQLGDIGDVLYTFPCVRAVKETRPDIRVAMAVHKKAAGLLACCPWVDEVVIVDRGKRSLLSQLTYQFKFWKRLRRIGFDLVVDLRTSSRGAIMAWLSGARVRVSRYIPCGEMWRNWMFTHLVSPAGPNGKEQYIAEYYHDMLAAYGFTTPFLDPKLEVTAGQRERIIELLGAIGIGGSQPIMALHPFSLWGYKDLSERKYIDLIGQLRKRFGVEILLIGSQVDHASCSRIAEAFDEGVHNLAGSTDLADLGALVSRCSLFIGVDSAGIHIAAAAGTPTVAIYGPSVPETWAPRGENHLVVRKNWECVPCKETGCQRSMRSRCLDELTVDEILEAVQQLAGRKIVQPEVLLDKRLRKGTEEPPVLSANKWKIFIMCHNVIWDKMYANDPDFSSEHYSFLKLGNQDLLYNPQKQYHIINESDFPVAFLEPHYAELTGMYCIYKNKLYKGLDYVGVSHYDKDHRLLGGGEKTTIDTLEAARYRAEVLRIPSSGPTDITRRITEAVNKSPFVHIGLEVHDFKKIYDQRVLMDKKQPNQFVGSGRNCFEGILRDYNQFFGTQFSMQDVAKDGFLSMCDCFVTPVYLFEKLMAFISELIESGALDIYDTERRHRLQGGLLERYVAVFFALENIEKVDLSTVHRHWEKKASGSNFLRQSLNKLFGRS